MSFPPESNSYVLISGYFESQCPWQKVKEDGKFFRGRMTGSESFPSMKAIEAAYGHILPPDVKMENLLLDAFLGQ